MKYEKRIKELLENEPEVIAEIMSEFTKAMFEGMLKGTSKTKFLDIIKEAMD